MSGIQFERKIQTHGQTQNKYKYKDKYKKNRQTYDVTFLWKVDDKRNLIMKNMQNMQNLQNMQICKICKIYNKKTFFLVKYFYRTRVRSLSTLVSNSLTDSLLFSKPWRVLMPTQNLLKLSLLLMLMLRNMLTTV